MLRYLTAGESHGPQLTAILDGFPSGFPVSIDRINEQLLRRQMGYGRGARMAIEKDEAAIVSGVRHGVTLGGPITLVIPNRDWANWRDTMNPTGLSRAEQVAAQSGELTCPRPGHADLPGAIKWHHHDIRNVLERASARETAARVAVGSLARQLLEYFDVEIASHVTRIGEVTAAQSVEGSDLKRVARLAEQSEVRCLDTEAGREMMAAISAAEKDQDTLGGVAEVIIRGLPAGLGGCAQWSDRLDGRLAGAVVAIPSVRGVEIGLGFEAAALRGSQVQDEIFYDQYGDPRKKRFHRNSNRAGGLEGGMTNGEDVVLRVAAKPLSTLGRPLRTVDVKTKEPATAVVERADTCVVPALAVVCEAVAALVLADAFLAKFGADSLQETERNFRTFLATDY